MSNHKSLMFKLHDIAKEKRENIMNHITQKSIDLNELYVHILIKQTSITNEEIRNLAHRLMTDKMAKFIVFSHMLENYHPKTKNLTMDEFIKEAQKIFIYFQNSGGGFSIEDTNWQIKTSKDKKYKLKENEIMFINSISQSDINDCETELYVNNIIRILNELATNIKVEYRLNEGTNKIFWILIKCRSE